jgi:MYXO-CTERM domain-containing protein
MRSERVLLSAFLTAAALLLASPDASAFCRTRTLAPPADFEPGTTSNDCFAEGRPLYHPSVCVPYHLLAKSSPTIPNDVLSASLARAFATWTTNTPGCTVGITPIELAPIDDAKIADYAVGQRGHNVIGVVDGAWPHPGTEMLSLATLTFDANTGEIFDADLEIRNDIPWGFATSGVTPPMDRYDLDAVLTHETGHFLGLSHSGVPEAVMFASYSIGSTTQRVLSRDDADGICAIYPNRQTRNIESGGHIASTACDLAPSTGGSSGTCGDPVVTHGCAVSSTVPAHAPGLGIAMLGALGVLAFLRRRSGDQKARVGVE